MKANIYEVLTGRILGRFSNTTAVEVRWNTVSSGHHPEANVTEKRASRKLDGLVPTSAFVGSNPTDERITSELPVIRPQSRIWPGHSRANTTGHFGTIPRLPQSYPVYRVVSSQLGSEKRQWVSLLTKVGLGLSHIGNVRSAISTTRCNLLRLAPPAA